MFSSGVLSPSNFASLYLARFYPSLFALSVCCSFFFRQFIHSARCSFSCLLLFVRLRLPRDCQLSSHHPFFFALLSRRSCLSFMSFRLLKLDKGANSKQQEELVCVVVSFLRPFTLGSSHVLFPPASCYLFVASSILLLSSRAEACRGSLMCAF